MKTRDWLSTLICVGAALSSTGCSELSNLLEDLFPPTGARRLSDDDAFRYISVDRQSAPATDVNSVMTVIDDEAVRATGGERSMMQMDTPQVSALMRRTIQARKTIDEAAFDRVDFTQFGLDLNADTNKAHCGDGYNVDVSTLSRDKFIIPGVDKIPIRDQGYRGTCAAFAAIGNIEYTALNADDSKAQGLPTLDLSEQRFYWMSKPDCQGDGCQKPFSEGSWYGVGFDASAAAGELDIPLETDCPYNKNPGDSDTQAPQKNSCSKGAVQIEEVGSWCGLEDLVDLLERGYAVPYASPLSGNWERNDGLITRKGLEGPGNGPHAGGHAYLIVGYKRLPDMPEEGGMCFIVKNSWGVGWGVNGYSCMTVGWMQEVTFDGFMAYHQPVALKINVREDLQSDELPPDNTEAEEETNPDLPLDEDQDQDDSDKLDPEEPDFDPAPEPDPEPPPPPPPAPDYGPSVLLGPNESYYKVEIAETAEYLYVKAKLRASQGETEPVRLQRKGDFLLYKGDVVGQYARDELRLCTGEWGHLCSLRYRKSDKRMYVQFRDDDLRSVKASETGADKGEWVDVDLGIRSYGVFLPADYLDIDFLLNPKTFLRLDRRDPARFTIRPSAQEPANFGLKLGGNAIGELKVLSPTSSSFCSGDFSNSCQFVNSDGLHTIPRNQRRAATPPPGG